MTLELLLRPSVRLSREGLWLAAGALVAPSGSPGCTTDERPITLLSGVDASSTAESRIGAVPLRCPSGADRRRCQRPGLDFAQLAAGMSLRLSDRWTIAGFGRQFPSGSVIGTMVGDPGNSPYDKESSRYR